MTYSVLKVPLNPNQPTVIRYMADAVWCEMCQFWFILPTSTLCYTVRHFL